MGSGRRALPPGTFEHAVHLLEDGLSPGAVARRFGVHRVTVSNWVGRAGYRPGRSPGWVIRPRNTVPDMADTVRDLGTGNGRRLDAAARGAIEALRAEDHTCAEIGWRLGFDASTVSRELRRGRAASGHYFARRGQAHAQEARKRPKQCKLEANVELRGFVADCLDKKFSPQQVCMELRQRHPDREDMRVSHEAIYQAIYVQGRGSLRQELKVEKALRSGRRGRVPQSRFPKRKGRSWVQGCHISTRPAEAEDRAVPGHWEGDLVIGVRHGSALITLAERCSRFTLLRRPVLDYGADTVNEHLIEMMKALPQELRKTITWDQGDELARHREFTLATDVKVFFCDPHSPWQRGTNENTNGLVRDFFPKGTDFHRISDDEIAEAQYLFNIRPRAVLGGISPARKLDQLLKNGALTT